MYFIKRGNEPRKRKTWNSGIKGSNIREAKGISRIIVKGDSKIIAVSDPTQLHSKLEKVRRL